MSTRIKIFSIIIALGLLILMGGLFRIQVTKYERYRILSEDNRLKVVPLIAPRGSIYDRKGRPMVKDVLCFNACVIYSRVKDFNRLAEVLSSVLEEPEESVLKSIKKSRAQSYVPFCVSEDIGMRKAVRLEEISNELPGLLMDVSTKRQYIYDNAASNILGYLGTINRSEFERLKHYGYSINDLVGRDGIEKYYDQYLRGTHGGKQVEVDHLGREAMTLGYKEPVPGKDIYLTLDLDLQLYCDELLEGKRGAIIAINPQTGEILAMSSAPSFDPAVFIDEKRKKERMRVLNSRDYPLLNRAISGAYPPGSVFKTIIAAAALETGVLDLSTTFYCSGVMTLGRRAFHCWKKEGHGDQNVLEALKNSCNVFFWRTGLLLGIDRIAEYSGKFGVGKLTGIDLPGEVSGIRPSREWKEKSIGQKWYKGETMNYSVGQGYLLCSPLQIARIMSVFANGKYLVTPYLVEKVGKVTVNSTSKKDIGILKKHIDTVREGLRLVVNDRRGTGMKARLREIVVSGKTGTAQTSRGENHGWFAGYAPYDNASLAVVIFDEYGGKGGYYAASTAGKVFKKAWELNLIK
jgi:penicillin-binding protein 2